MGFIEQGGTDLSGPYLIAISVILDEDGVGLTLADMTIEIAESISCDLCIAGGVKRYTICIISP